jgi:hypothetical protein
MLIIFMEGVVRFASKVHTITQKIAQAQKQQESIN